MNPVMSRKWECLDPWGQTVPCPTVAIDSGGFPAETMYRPPERTDNTRPDCDVNLPPFSVATKRDLAKAFQYIKRNNSVSCIGPAIQAYCARIPTSLRKFLPRDWRGWCNTSGGLMGLSAYSSRAEIISAVANCKNILRKAAAVRVSNPTQHMALMNDFVKCAALLIGSTDAKGAKYLPTPFRQMWAAENRSGSLAEMGADPVAAPTGYSESANIFSTWVSAISNAASQLTNNYMQIRQATGKQVVAQPIISTDSFGGGNTMLYVGGGIALLAVLMLAKR